MLNIKFLSMLAVYSLHVNDQQILKKKRQTLHYIYLTSLGDHHHSLWKQEKYHQAFIIFSITGPAVVIKNCYFFDSVFNGHYLLIMVIR